LALFADNAIKFGSSDILIVDIFYPINMYSPISVKSEYPSSVVNSG
jgi:hypothetical protein